jgi:hypothetical protein
MLPVRSPSVQGARLPRRPAIGGARCSLHRREVPVGGLGSIGPMSVRQTSPLVAEILDPVLVPMGFAPGQVGAVGATRQVIFCRGAHGSPDGGCVDLVVELEAAPDWRVSDVRYWGFPADRWHLGFDRDASLADQLRRLAHSLPGQLE